MNKIVKKLILSVLLISLSTTNTYPIFGFDYIKRFFVSTTSSLVTNVRQTFTSLFNVFRRRQHKLQEKDRELQRVDKDLSKAQEKIAKRQAEIASLSRGVEEAHQELQQKDQELQGATRANERLCLANEVVHGQREKVAQRDAEINRLNAANSEIDQELQERSEELKRIANENALMVQEDIASQSREIVEQKDFENEVLRRQVADDNENVQALQQENRELRFREGQIRERSAEINELRNSKCVSQYDLQQKEDLQAMFKLEQEAADMVSDGVKVLQLEEEELGSPKINNQKAINQSPVEESEGISRLSTAENSNDAKQAEGSLPSKGKEREGEKLSSICRPEAHWLVKAGFIKPIPGTTVEVSGNRDLSCSVIDLSDNGPERVVSVGSSSDRNLQEIKDEELEGNWVEVKTEFDNKMVSYGNYHFCKRLISPSKKDNGKIVFACVHGTFSDSKSYGTDYQKEMTGYLNNFAKILSKSFNRSVKFISIDWSGKLDFDHRKEAGGVLGEQLLRELDDDPRTQIWTFAHSHGANVVAFAAEKMKEYGKDIECAIHVASPVQDVRDSRGFVLPLNAKVLYHFYGTADVTQVIGSLLANYSLNRKLEFNPEPGSRFHNIRLMDHGKELDHIEIKKVVARNLPSLLYNIDTYYPCHADLDANIDGHDGFTSAWQIAIRDKIKVFDYRLSENVLEKILKHSGEIESVFERKYKHSIHDKYYGHGKVRRALDRILAPVNEGLSALKGRLRLEGSPQSSS